MLQNTRTLRLFVWFASLMLSVNTASTARADFQRDAIRKSVEQAEKRLMEESFKGFSSLESPEELDLKQPFTEEEVQMVLTSLLKAFGHAPWIHEHLPQLMHALRANAPQYTNILFYIGLDVGYGIGINTNLALIFGRDRESGQIGISHGLVARIQAFDIGSNLHLGVATLQEESASVFTGGLMLGGAFLVGTGIGSGGGPRGAQETWAEVKIGLGVQAGAYLEFVL